MRNILYASASDLGPPLRLKELIGPERVARFRPAEHPLGAGFRALEKRLIGQAELSTREMQELGNVVFVARALFEREDDWANKRFQLADDLARADECSAVVFELQVIKFALAGGVTHALWQRYREGVPDIVCSSPDMLVECKLVRAVEVHRDTVFDAISMARHQHKTQKSLPLVVAVGFEKNLSAQASTYLQQECRTRGPWFRQRPDVSAVLLFLPRRASDLVVDELALPRVSFMGGMMLEIINHSATLPLPVGFAWGSSRAQAPRVGRAGSSARGGGRAAGAEEAERGNTPQ